MPTKPVAPNFSTMSCCIFAISLSADCLTDDSKSQSMSNSQLFARFPSHRVLYIIILVCTRLSSLFILVSIILKLWRISFHNLAFHSQLAIATSTSCVWHRVQVRCPSAHHASLVTKVQVLRLESLYLTPDIQTKASETLNCHISKIIPLWTTWKNRQLLIDVSLARTQRWRRFSSRRRTSESKDGFKLRFWKKMKNKVILHP